MMLFLGFSVTRKATKKKKSPLLIKLEAICLEPTKNELYHRFFNENCALELSEIIRIALKMFHGRKEWVLITN